MKTANLAIVFTDLEGFTARTSQQTLEENERLLSTHNALLEPLFKAFGGRVVKMIGDAFLVTFESPTSAVLAGVAIQDRLWQHNRGLPASQRLDVRVAINVGEVRLESGDVFGEPVNIAARVEGIAEAGEVTFTEAVHLAMNRAEVAGVELGEFELKGIPGKVRCYRVPHAPHRLHAPAPGTPAPPADLAEQPPFGNLGLARVKDELLRSHGSPQLGQKAAELARQGAELATQAATKAVSAVQRRGFPASRLLLVAGAAVVLVGLALFALRGDPIERAIEEVAAASSSQRGPKLEAARALINQEKDPAQRNAWLGELAAADEDGSAVGYYRVAAKAGSRRAEDKLIAMLEHARCSWRSAAADALGDLGVARAKGALERLEERGGADDGEQVLFLGCNSKNAAQNALRRLERSK